MTTSDHEGMVPREQWAESSVHKASTYTCGKCGQAFADPHALYDHLDAEHPKKEVTRGKRRVDRRSDA